MTKKPNVIFVFADQWRQQATSYAGDPNVKTPNLDSLAKESVNFTHALSSTPVSSPYRASLLTGQRPLTHGVFVNDVHLQPRATSIAQAFSAADYNTAYIGKWHIDGHGRSNYIPPTRRLGFQYFKALECSHDYNHSPYFAGDSDKKLYWNGYDAIAQTCDAQTYLRNHEKDSPFFLMLSFGPPHAPYDTAPDEFKKLYNPNTIKLRPNVPNNIAPQARKWLAGYYAHCSALDTCIGHLMTTIRECNIENNTIFVFTSDHGDMLGSHGNTKKQQPWDESIRVPFLLKYPSLPNWRPKKTDALIDAPDIMPTLLSLCDIPIPDTVQGRDLSIHIAQSNQPSDDSALISCPHPFGQWSAPHHGGREYRGLRTKRYTYVRDLQHPWLFYDNETDPYQMRNLVHDPKYTHIRDELDHSLQKKLNETDDQFLPGTDYIKKWGYTVDETGTIPYTD